MVLQVKRNTKSEGPDVSRAKADDTARARVLDVAEALFYRQGIQTVGMDDIRDASRVSLKRLYRLFPAKEELVVAVLGRRDVWWRQELAAHVERHEDPEARILAVFDWLEAWFVEPGFRGCAWVNAYGELGSVSAPVAEQARLHKSHFRAYLGQLVAAAGLAPELADSVALLAEGAMVTAGIFGTPAPVTQARAAARNLVTVAKKDAPATPSSVVR